MSSPQYKRLFEAKLTPTRALPQRITTQDELDDEIAGWKTALGLDYWRIEARLNGEMFNDNMKGECANTPDYDSAVITLSTDRVKYWEGHQNDEEVVIHELLHLLFRNFDRAIEQSMKAIDSPVLREFAEAMIGREREALTEKLARIMAALRYEEDHVRVGGMLPRGDVDTAESSN